MLGTSLDAARHVCLSHRYSLAIRVTTKEESAPPAFSKPCNYHFDCNSIQANLWTNISYMKWNVFSYYHFLMKKKCVELSKTPINYKHIWHMKTIHFYVCRVLHLISVEARFFFRSTVDHIQHPSNLSGVQGPSSPVVHGSQDMKRNSQKPSTKSKPQRN